MRVQRFHAQIKIHRATLTGTELDYEGSIAIDRDLIEAADLLPGEQVHVLNLNNAQRLITYVIEGAGRVGHDAVETARRSTWVPRRRSRHPGLCIRDGRGGPAAEA